MTQGFEAARASEVGTSDAKPSGASPSALRRPSSGACMPLHRHWHVFSSDACEGCDAQLMAMKPATTATAASTEKAFGICGSTSHCFGRRRSESIASGTVSESPTVATLGDVSNTAVAHRYSLSTLSSRPLSIMRPPIIGVSSLKSSTPATWSTTTSGANIMKVATPRKPKKRERSGGSSLRMRTVYVAYSTAPATHTMSPRNEWLGPELSVPSSLVLLLKPSLLPGLSDSAVSAFPSQHSPTPANLRPVGLSPSQRTERRRVKAEEEADMTVEEVIDVSDIAMLYEQLAANQMGAIIAPSRAARRTIIELHHAIGGRTGCPPELS
mmetsp:Transcript_18053/g.46153  ORF Transcript_18053/g.46153 Transcript_18053/m.46153 type:complete len:326 (-) Transcript_18053:208-1185(-)